jgi:hypothetical protein
MSEQEDEQVAEARRRDEERAQALGAYTPVQQVLDTTAEREDLWRQMVELLERVAEVGPDALAIPALRLLERINAL